jgi:DNA-binding NarL/FixJ family response regulator
VELLLAESSWTAALAALDAVPARRRPVSNPAWAPWGALAARALAGLDRHEEAVARATKEVAAARAWGSPSAVGPALRALGVALDGAGDEEAVDVLEQAVAATEERPPRLEHAMSLAALGSVVRRRRRPSLARPHLERAAELARACGATPLADHAAAEFRAAGGVRLSRRGIGAEALTPSERRVAGLAATGRSNKAIAQELFVTPKTVEVHLSNTYRKLGVTSRAGLAGQLPPET